MNEDLSEEVWAVIGALVIIALLLLFAGEPLQKRGFMMACATDYTPEECLKMWELGNG